MEYWDKLKAFFELLHPYVELGNAYIGLLLSIPVIWTWMIVVNRRRRERRILDKIKVSPGKRPVILIVSLLRGQMDMRAHVENYRQQHEDLKAIPPESIFYIKADDIIGGRDELTMQDMDQYFRTIDGVVGRIFQTGADTVHYFHGGPFPTSATIGALLSNGPRVMMYHWNKGNYENWGPLRPFHLYA